MRPLFFLIVLMVYSLIFVSSRSSARLDPDLLLDDIIPESLSRSAVASSDEIWPNGTVYYKISKEFDEEHVEYIYRAMDKIASVSCVSFIPATENMVAFLNIRPSESVCEASVGYGECTRDMDLKIGPVGTECFSTSFMEHLLMHALGFFHEHRLPNRDKYVKINYENIIEKYVAEFDKLNESKITNLSLPYDYESIMQVPTRTFSVNGKETIKPLLAPADIKIGEAKGLSQIDILKLNKLYNCCD